MVECEHFAGIHARPEQGPTYFRPGMTVTFPKLSRITREPSVQVKFPKARGLKPA